MATILIDSTAISLLFDNVQKIVKVIRYTCYIVFFIKIIKDLINEKKITWVMVCLTMLVACIWYFSKNKDVIFLVLVLIACRKLEINKLIKISFKVFTVIFLMIINLSLLNIFPDWTYNRGNGLRHSLGFYYPTIAIGTYLSIILMYFYIKRTKCTYMELLVLETINIFLYKYTDGRLSFILISVILLMMGLLKIKLIRGLLRKKWINSAIEICCYLLPLVMFSIVIILTYLYEMDNNLAIEINELLSNRIEFTEEGFNTFEIKPFGQKINWKGWGGHGYIDTEEINDFKYNYVDISYARIIFDYGIIPTIVILIAYTALFVRSFKRGDYWLLCTLFFILIWSMIEPFIINIGKNIFVMEFIPFLEIGEIDLIKIKNFIRRDRNAKSNS